MTPVTARRHRHHQSRTTIVWSVLDGTAQGMFRGLDCAAQGVGFGFLGLIARREGLGFRVLVARRGKVLLVVRREEGSGCGGPHSLYMF